MFLVDSRSELVDIKQRLKRSAMVREVKEVATGKQQDELGALATIAASILFVSLAFLTVPMVLVSVLFTGSACQSGSSSIKLCDTPLENFLNPPCAIYCGLTWPYYLMRGLKRTINYIE